jgi:hypothetical protein
LDTPTYGRSTYNNTHLAVLPRNPYSTIALTLSQLTQRPALDKRIDSIAHRHAQHLFKCDIPDLLTQGLQAAADAAANIVYSEPTGGNDASSESRSGFGDSNDGHISVGDESTNAIGGGLLVPGRFIWKDFNSRL